MLQTHIVPMLESMVAMEPHLPFRDRKDAGEQLSKLLSEYKGKPDVLILALVRGGIVVGQVLSQKLQLPLHPYIVRKLGHPHNREFALGAIAEGGETYLDEGSLKVNGLAWSDIDPIIEEERAELKRRKATYAVKPRPALAGTTIILTDDGAATGATLFAAIADLRKAKAKHVIVALPVCPPDTAVKLRRAADDIVVVETPRDFMAVGQWYLSFPQISDDEVLSILSATS